MVLLVFGGVCMVVCGAVCVVEWVGVGVRVVV